MIDAQYFIDIISKVEKIIRYKNVYEDYYSKGVIPNDTIMLFNIIFLFFGLVLCSLIIPILAEKKKFTTKEKLAISVIIFITSFIIVTISSQNMQSYEEEIRECKIELNDLKTYSPIDFSKFPKWASDGLREDGYIKCVRIYKFLKEQENNIKQENDRKVKEKEISLRTKEMKEMGNMGD